ncbi:hypothetical protein D3C79_734820 [compost metagenome]
MVFGQVVDHATVRREPSIHAFVVIDSRSSAQGSGVEITAIPAEAATSNQRQTLDRAEGDLGVQAVLFLLHTGFGAVVR